LLSSVFSTEAEPRGRKLRLVVAFLDFDFFWVEAVGGRNLLCLEF
jgi:hypothetical protein